MVNGLLRTVLLKSAAVPWRPRHSNQSRSGLIRTSPLTKDQWLILQYPQQNKRDCDIFTEPCQQVCQQKE